jgi:hypothetical protein
MVHLSGDTVGGVGMDIGNEHVLKLKSSLLILSRQSKCQRHQEENDEQEHVEGRNVVSFVVKRRNR